MTRFTVASALVLPDRANIREDEGSAGRLLMNAGPTLEQVSNELMS